MHQASLFGRAIVAIILCIMDDLNKQFNALDEWYQTARGQTLAEAVAKHLAPLLSNVPGCCCAQLGLPSQRQWLELSSVAHQITLTQDANPWSALQANFNYLPFPSQSLDLILLPHTLAFTRHPARLFEEIYRVLAPRGVVVAFGFNTFSLHSLIKPFVFPRRQPWTVPAQMMFKIRQNLDHFSFNMKSYETFFYRPLFENEERFQKYLIMETIGNMTWMFPGNMYALSAQKQVMTTTRIKPIWSFKNIVVGKRFIQPST